MAKIKCTYKVEEWKEEIAEAFSMASKFASVRAQGPLSGEIVGQVSMFYLLAYVTEKEGKYSGYTQISGRYGSHEGTFLVEESGVFDGETVCSSMTVVPGSGTGGFERVSGRGEYVASHGNAVESLLELEFVERAEQA
ncbi:Protein of unknown function [Pseudovibrio ascidiaceicola]|uniref:DUF3224 domain-containing protein n=1 Tax=Pseudovibrio ascidiaceicola TaxID=285279 RepID=A0A1I4AHA3_9HYPH|nr:DUF3224 domain-containing protein [Pseudovibrio ascidiaceicola]SFK55842.1 Protein of unknown function [Pseudovibrio ascidiaceicola]